MTELCTQSRAAFGRRDQSPLRGERGKSAQRARRGLLPVLAALALWPAISQGQGAASGSVFPNKPVMILVPNAAGGPSDLIARLVAPKLSETLRQNVIVDNRSSNNGIVAAEMAARAAADGTVIFGGNSGTHAVNATLYRKLPYDPIRDFAPITEAIASGLVAVANPKLPVESIRDLIAYAKNAPGKVNFAIAGATGEIAVNVFKKQAQIDANNVNYKGGSPAVFAVISGEAQLNLANYSTVAQLVEAGKLKIIGVTGARRDPLLPNVPTFAENGLDGYEVEIWYGFFAPAKTPPALVQAYYREIARIVNLPEIKDRLVAGGYTVVASPPEQFGEKVKRDLAKYRKIILESGMQLD
jgi:tripartite-type tricarboxylate transporter receptor subunit TctC